ncbi:hypothetical protein MAPG_06642 [Magnaporthiopsis poae ATCC 64411]|uniref:receptor protein-tyrosine kinase n=1 Tax=Magnaporthiopsis poae (strain ATCC 64411 / 73-15) TaxID=644358 RepID=A0A0C4E2K1_MAGP6|nr:hypothetical protein MAPG_06642 [Magnaporthiopsis poae ATCC 64411]
MPETRRPRLAMRTALAIAVYAASTAASYIPARSLFLLERQNTCGISGHRQCPGSGVPAGFCCSASDACMMLAGGTTVLCCPQGDNCARIKPISCDVKLQNPASHPESVVKTNVFNVELATCDNGCCPFGYTCSDKICVADANQDTPPGPAKQSSSSRPAPTTSGRAGAISTTSPASGPATSTSPPTSGPATTAPSSGATSSTTNANPSATAIPGSAENVDGTPPPPGNSVTTPSIIGGVVGALMFLIVVAIGIFFCYRRKKKNAGAEAAVASPRSDGTSAGATVGQNYLQYPAPSPARTLTGRTAAAPQIPPIRGMRSCGYGGISPPSTPPMRQPSTESIDVYVDGGRAAPVGRAAGNGGKGGGGAGRRVSTDTTFTALMRQADFPDPRYGAKFVPPAAFATPERRA